MEKEKFLKYSLVLVLGLILLGGCAKESTSPQDVSRKGSVTPSPSPTPTLTPLPSSAPPSIDELEKSNFDLWLSVATLVIALGGVAGITFLLLERRKLFREVKSLEKETRKIPALVVAQVNHISKDRYASKIPSMLPADPHSREEFQKLLQDVKFLSQQIQNLQHQFAQQAVLSSHRDLQEPQHQVDKLHREINNPSQASSPTQKHYELTQQGVPLPSDELSHQDIPSESLQSNTDVTSSSLLHPLPEWVAKRVETYNIDPKSAFSPGHDIEVSEVSETMTRVDSGIETIALEGKSRNQGSYWLFENEWLFPKKISQSNYETVQLLFVCHNAQGDSSRGFQLIRPAKVSPVGSASEKQEWNLKEQGELNFID